MGQSCGCGQESRVRRIIKEGSDMWRIAVRLVGVLLILLGAGPVITGAMHGYEVSGVGTTELIIWIVVIVVGAALVAGSYLISPEKETEGG